MVKTVLLLVIPTRLSLLFIEPALKQSLKKQLFSRNFQNFVNFSRTKKKKTKFFLEIILKSIKFLNEPFFLTLLLSMHWNYEKPVAHHLSYPFQIIFYCSQPYESQLYKSQNNQSQLCESQISCPDPYSGSGRHRCVGRCRLQFFVFEFQFYLRTLLLP